MLWSFVGVLRLDEHRCGDSGPVGPPCQSVKVSCQRTIMVRRGQHGLVEAE